jgi:hypothetical protein
VEYTSTSNTIYREIYREHVFKSGTGKGDQGRRERRNEREQIIKKYNTSAWEEDTDTL